MLNRIIFFSIKNKLVIGVFTIAIIVWGVWSTSKLPIDALPDITNNQVQIITTSPSLAAPEVERLVTFPIELAVATVPELVEIRSISRFGLSVITVVFEENTNIYWARQQVFERLQEAVSQIPPGIGEPTMGPISTGLGEIYQYILRPKPGAENKYTLAELRTMQDWIVARQLYGTPGVAEVNGFGGILKQYEVAVRPDRLQSYNITISDIMKALEQNNENAGGAYIDKKPNAYYIRSLGLATSLEDVGNIVIRKDAQGIPILIKNVATPQFGGAVRYGALTYNGEREVVGGVVMMLKGSNSAEVVKSVKEKMAMIQKALPEDVLIEAYLDRTDLIGRAINTVKTNLIEGAVIVIFVLVLFLGNLRAGLIVASAIPLSMLFALSLMRVFGVSANLMSLGAIDFGLIVDGAVIVVEATMHHLGLRRSVLRMTQDEMDKEVYESAAKIRNSAAFGEIIIMMVYIPILTLSGIEGKMFRPMAQTVSFAILGALILSMTYIPMMCAFFLSKKPISKKSFSDRMMEKIQHIYMPLLKKALRLRYCVLGVTILISVTSAYMFSKMGAEFIPQLKEGDFAFQCVLPQGASLSQSIETSMIAAKIIRKFDEVKMVVGKTGSAEVPTDPMPPEASDMMVILKDPDEWTSGRSYEQLAADMEKALEALPGVYIEVNQPIQMRFNELMTGIRQDVAVKIFGEDLDSLEAYSKQVAQIVGAVNGTSGVLPERTSGLPQITVTYDYGRIARYGATIKDLNATLSTAFGGTSAGLIYENERRFDLVVRLDSAAKQSINDVRNLYVPIAGGGQVALSQVATIEFKEGPAQISRDDAKRRIVVGFNVSGRDVQHVVDDIKSRLDSELKLPEGYFYIFGGQFENLQEASSRLLIAVPVALASIFALLFFTFGSVKEALLIFTAIPMSAVGGMLALELRGMPFSISAGVGFIALFGVAVLNGIVLISTFNQLKKTGHINLLRRILMGAEMRLRPVLMTATVASLGFLPMALSTGSGAEVQKPLATVVIGGLVSATFLTLFVLPILYLMFNRLKRSGSSTSLRRLTAVLAVIALGAVYSPKSYCQTVDTPLSTVSEAIAIALKNNPNLKEANVNVLSQRALERTAFDPANINITADQSPLEGASPDNNLGISQSFSLPGVYRANKRLLRSQTGVASRQLDLTRNDLIRDVRTAYANLQYAMALVGHWAWQDSLLNEFLKIAELRYKTGETAKTELLAASNRYRQLQLMRQQAKATEAAAEQELKRLLNVRGTFKIISEPWFRLPLIKVPDSAYLQDNPLLALARQQQEVAEASVKKERSGFLPEITLGYQQQMILKRWNPEAINKSYGSSTHIAGVSVGLAFPILNLPARKAQVKAAVLNRTAADYAYERVSNDLKTAFSQQLGYYQQLADAISFYESEGIREANELIASAQLGYRKGALDYVAYTQNVEQGFNTRLQYLETLRRLNQAISEINYYIGN
ncbi:CusA/CzcA family heavy metal efflux RND transporter [Olivibacter sp. XZL3]|uniref:CusA/CzcA family heavy metal efflux RND transporter n=1 Tax=Olivibacter sp. XZL3 TaxID=1735116 RepID=UPI001064D8C4|nr:CusA/CzcA family heavy metal efflux RND transporter [Olivibacter sp. XZL3]